MVRTKACRVPGVWVSTITTSTGLCMIKCYIMPLMVGLREAGMTEDYMQYSNMIMIAYKLEGEKKAR